MLYFRRWSGLILAFFLLISAVGVLAQSDLGSITGTVTDPSGAVIAGAAITVTNTATSVVTKAETGPGGNYTVLFLKPGNYRIAVAESGFKTFVQSGLTVSIGQTLHQDVTLTLGQVNQTVEVKGQGTQLQAESSDIGIVVNSRQVEDLPLAGQSEVRTPAAFMILDSAVNARGTASNGEGPGGWRQFDTTVAGGENATTEFDVEGARVVNGQQYYSANYATLGFPPDAVGEFKVMTVTRPAEFGGSAGGIVTLDYKSGTNQFHGSAYEYLRNDALNARGFYVPTRTANKQNEFGGVIGGPIHKDKTFFFGWYEGFRLDLGASNGLATVPTAQMKEGNFTEYTSGGVVIPIYDPTTTAPDGQGGFTRQQMSCNGVLNVMCANQINKFAADLIPAWPTPTNSGLVGNYLQLGVSHQRQTEWGAKIDHSFSARHKIYGSFSMSDLTTPPGADMPGILSTQGTGQYNGRTFRLDDDIIIRPNLVNHAVFGFNRVNGLSGCTSGECPSIGWPGKVGYT